MKLKPVMRTDEHHQQKHESILRMIRERNIDVVFLGDSLTRRWEDNSHLWSEFFSRFNPANFGVGGDCIENVLWRITNGEIDGIGPRLFLVLVGTNNLCKNTEDEIVDGIEEVVSAIRSRCPRSKVVEFGLLPRNRTRRVESAIPESPKSTDNCRRERRAAAMCMNTSAITRD